MGNDAHSSGAAELYRKEALDRLAEGELLDEAVAVRGSLWAPLCVGLTFIFTSLMLWM